MRIIIKPWILMILLLSANWAAAANLTDIQFASMSGDRTEVVLTFDGPAPDANSYSIEKPARISIDLPTTVSQVEKYHQIGTGNARSAIVLTAGDRTRMILNLTTMVPYTVNQSGNQLVVLVGEQLGVAPTAAEVTPATQTIVPTQTVAQGPELLVPSAQSRQPVISRVENVDFRRGREGEGQIIITFSNDSANADIQDVSGRIRIEVPDFELPTSLQRRLDVIDFATPVEFIDSYAEGGDSIIVIESTGVFEYLAYQTDRRLTIDVKEISEEEQEQTRREKFPYTGEKLSLNFQDIPVRSVLQLIADFTGLNLVASDSISGNITLRLKNVPWDQALELVLKTKGLDKRQNGNVLLVAPAEEIAAREKLELEANSQVEQLAPLSTEFIQINYAKAGDIMGILLTQQDTAAAVGEGGNGAALASSGGLISPRGSIAVDDRTNTLMVRDTASNLERVRQAVSVFDVPIRQVLIEARIVVARSTVGKDLGIRWGFGADSNRVTSGDNYFVAGSGGLESNVEIGNYLSDPDEDTYITYPNALAVNLPVQNPSASAFAIGVTTLDYVLDLELSALESNGNGEIVSQPKILTADGRAARILSGTEVPYVTADGIEFREAVLSLEVLPHITPDNRFVLDLVVTQDSVGDIVEGAITINKNQLDTQVLVDNGETIVLGGIYQSNEVKREDKTPFLGDLPYVGRLFSRSSTSEEKNELLIFITPKLVDDQLAGR